LPERLAPEARAHAAACARCAPVLAAAIEIDALLAAPSTLTAPAGFTDRLMARIAEVSAVRARAPLVAPPAFPWWIRAATQPAAALALAMAALVAWRGDALVAAAIRLARGMAGGPPIEIAPVAAPLDRPEVLFGLVLGFLPVLAGSAWLLYRGCERLVLAAPRGGRLSA
jgi:hypothetical protein